MSRQPVTLQTLTALRDHPLGAARIAIETGTYQGATTRLLAGLFDTVHTIELSEHLARTARAALADLPNVHGHLGDSAAVFPALVAEIHEPLFAYLDAHWFRAAHVAGHDHFPLWAELAALRDRPYADTVIVDDLHAFEGRVPITDDWLSVSVHTVHEALDVERVYLVRLQDDHLAIYRRPTDQRTPTAPR
jgi:hypothetical protein